MGKCLFTIFQGPDAGRRFTLESTAVTLGRDDARDVVLHDDRASRLHATIEAGEPPRLVDAGSSNGTFVNGALVKECELSEGDIIVIGANSIVMGAEKPSKERLAASRPGARPVAPITQGATTHLLPEDHATNNATDSHLGPILEAVAEALKAEAWERGIHISLELDTRHDMAFVDPQQLFRAWTGILRHMIGAIPRATNPENASRAECALALRLTSSDADAFRIESFGVGLPVPREKMAQDPDALPLREARKVATAHGGVLELLPPDAPATLARMLLPKSSTGMMRTMMR